MSATDMKHLLKLDGVAYRDVKHVKHREQTYKGSWKKRGGVGAFMMLARKWDRLEEFMKSTYNYDVFEGVRYDPSGADGTVLAEIRDLRQYLLLVESEMVARGVVKVVCSEDEDTLDQDTLNEIRDSMTPNQIRKSQGLRPIGSDEDNTPGTPEDGGHHDKFNGDHPVESGRTDRT